ncbi:hypothetical protein [Streptococcus zalophi]|uniref:hypothetical protein n=1 Tax=Streptococcus zalophi TaxID=640031 RepID=UPI00215C8188|nr:hypothetical protein [Streptococcus zalophi]MCR8967517.1 hypothetical protein [Streptococcus zalophi]
MKKFSMEKICIIFVIGFVLPFIFTLPITTDIITNDKINFLKIRDESIGSFLFILRTGFLFSSSFSLIATLMLNYFDNNIKRKSNGNYIIKDSKIKNPILSILILFIINAVFYGVTLKKSLNGFGIAIEIILYICFLLLYGHIDFKISTTEEVTLAQTQQYNDSLSEELNTEIDSINKNNTINDNISNKKL